MQDLITAYVKDLKATGAKMPGRYKGDDPDQMKICKLSDALHKAKG